MLILGFQMCRAGPTLPDATTYSTLINIMAASEDWHKALAFQDQAFAQVSRAFSTCLVV